ncbi:MAG: hypothetical protein BGO63_08510 [Candidatus Accumulibacter sp. 66-26]|nr:DUF1282 family protein [Accumulibacter sp.]OJW49315.1 MAG: hypothetical protein BGO63_08510 [Candidatus Accumulibacter sp. 66-26]
MNPMMFPKMLSSHAEGWEWLMRVHPSVPRMYLAYVVPMSAIPPAMLLYAWHAYSGAPLLEISRNQAMLLAAVFFVSELLMVPIMAWVVQRIGAVADAQASYRDAFALAAVVPTPLWLMPVALFVPSVVFHAAAMLLALAASAALIYQGVDRVYRLEDEGHSRLAAGSVFAAGLVAWVLMMGLAFVSWGMVLT